MARRKATNIPGQLELAALVRPTSAGMADTIEAASPDWWSRAERAVRALAAEGRPFQAYDVVLRLGMDEPDNTRAQWGALFGALRKAGVIEPCGYAQSSRPTTAKSAVRLWRGVQRKGDAA
jgi:hypothetical protein